MTATEENSHAREEGARRKMQKTKGDGDGCREWKLKKTNNGKNWLG